MTRRVRVVVAFDYAAEDGAGYPFDVDPAASDHSKIGDAVDAWLEPLDGDVFTVLEFAVREEDDA